MIFSRWNKKKQTGNNNNNNKQSIYNYTLNRWMKNSHNGDYWKMKQNEEKNKHVNSTHTHTWHGLADAHLTMSMHSWIWLNQNKWKRREKHTNEKKKNELGQRIECVWAVSGHSSNVDNIFLLALSFSLICRRLFIHSYKFF